MFWGIKKIFLLGISMCYTIPCIAQFIDDIPLFEETPSASKNIQTEKKNTPTSLVISPKAEESKSEPEKDVPDIGRNAPPRDKIILTPPPLPEISIDLRNRVPTTVVQPQPVVPVNTRQEGIYIPPVDKTSISPAQPSNFANFHDVRQFDLEGFYLGMTPQAVLQMAKQKRYQISKIKKAIPLFRTTHYDTLCRESGIRAPEMIRACINQHAKNDKQDYVEEILLTRKTTHESFHFKFTSPATDNEVYQVTYNNKGDNSLNFTRPNLVKKLNRKEAFFNAVFNMYGYPDDNKELVWGNKKDAYMQVEMVGSAYDATIRLMDVKLSNEDYFEASDWKKEQESTYHFGFEE